MLKRTEAISEAERELLQYLRWLKDHVVAQEGWLYRGPADYLLQQGQFFEPQSATHGMPVGIPRYCYANAYRFAQISGGTLRYAEGVGRTSSPRGSIHDHAWCVDEDGRVVDPTWGGPLQPPAGAAYFGAIFDLDLVGRARKGQKASASVLDDWRNNYPLLQNPPGSSSRARRPLRLMTLVPAEKP
jgi:hypothetical protein